MGKPPAAAWEAMQNSQIFTKHQSPKEAALAWAKAGLPVFPCKLDKSPFTSHSFKNASRDLQQVEAWWTAKPYAMIGLPTGPVSGVWVLDIDAPKEGRPADGRVSLAELEAKHGPLPATRTHATAGGGLHLLFRYPTEREIARTVKQIAPGLDVKAAGGYVIVPPSVNGDEGKAYSVLDASPPVDAPAWLLDLAFPPFTAPVPLDRVPASQRRVQGGDLHPYVEAAVAGDLAELSAASEGTRNDTLNAVSFNLGKWVGGGELSEAEARDALKRGAAACGLDEREAEKTIDSGLPAGMREPRIVPESKPRQETKAAQPERECQGNQPPHIPAESAAYQPGQDQPARRFTLTHGADLPDDPPQWLVEDFIVSNSLGMVFGESEAGKSFVAIALACSVASGDPFFNQMTAQSPVIYLAGEGNLGLKQRERAWAIHHRHRVADIPLYFSNMAVPLDDPHSLVMVQEAIDEMAEWAGTPKLIIIDTLARFCGGDENSTKDTSSFIAALDTLRLRYQTTILVIHHVGHGEKGRGRGSSALRAALDFEFCLSLTGDGNTRMLGATKMKDAERPAPMYFKLDPVELEATDGAAGNLDFPTTCPVLTLADYDPPPRQTAAGKGRNQVKAMDILRELFEHHRANLEASGHSPAGARVTVEEWHDECARRGINKNRFREVKNALESQGVVAVENGYILVSYEKQLGTETTET